MHAGRIRHVDLLIESFAAVAAKPSRAALTAIGTVLGVAALVTTLGLTSTARAQVSSQFDEYAATEVRVTVAQQQEAALGLPADAESRIERVPGVQEAGLLWAIGPGPRVIQRLWYPMESIAASQVDLFAASPGALSVLALSEYRGRTFDDGHETRADSVVLLSKSVARMLSIYELGSHTTVFIDDKPFAVLGIYGNSQRHPETLAGAIVPSGTARRHWGLATTGRRQLVIQTRPGAAQVVAEQAPVALRSDDPESLHAEAPPDPRRLRSQVDTDIANLFLVLSVVSVAAGAFGIANITLVSVLERVPEIGVRRALGARRRDIARQFLAESAVLGSIGGLVGAALGAGAIAAVSYAKTWTATIEPLGLLPTPLLGTLAGLLAGLYPAMHASRIPPVAALRR